MVYSFLYVLIYSFPAVFLEKLYSSIAPLFSLLIAASIATLFFNIINLGKLKKVYIECWRERKMWLAIMCTILIMWSCSVFAPGMIGASLYTFLYFAFLGMLGFISLAIIDWSKNRIKLFFGLAILILILFVVGAFLGQKLTKINLICTLLGFIGGTSAFVYFKQSQILLKRIQISATQILAVRFYLTIIVLFLILLHGSFSLYFTVSNFLQLMLLAAISLIIPLYFSQKALEKISSEKNAIVMSISPFSPAVLQGFLFHTVDLKYVIIYLLYSTIIAASYLFKTR
jgi:hypothetical protein